MFIQRQELVEPSDMTPFVVHEVCAFGYSDEGRAYAKVVGMFSPTTGDVILRGSIDGSFRVLDAIREDRVAGPLQLKEALAFVRQYGARRIFQQAVDERGRLMGDPWRLARTKASR